MDYLSLEAFLEEGKAALTKSPVAVILVEDLVAVDATIQHHLEAGFRSVIVLAPPALTLPPAMAAAVHRIPYDMRAPEAMSRAMNRIIAACPETTWLYYCYNAEFLFHPFCETRDVREMVTFHTEERRDAMLSYVVDLYAPDLNTHPNAVCLEGALLDKSGYFALARTDENGHGLERQYDFYGGLRWRFEEHIPPARRKIDRISLFRAQRGLTLRENHTFNIEEYNTYACPWHHNITCAVMSFRVAKALKTNPGSSHSIHRFHWYNSVPFGWNSQQLMDLGLMEPGQWF
ncbi:hypothetical protein [Phaeovulum sp. W22_SRMD_FR3]|uniref:hypothetical protein n=1 Tax=Phaeovulum sp. W22_SRMD_FR3 TaxID=3240274 RepID=UPI003F97378D